MVNSTSAGGRELKRNEATLIRFAEHIGISDVTLLDDLLCKVNSLDDLLEVTWYKIAYMVWYKKLIEKSWREMGGGIVEHMCNDYPDYTFVGEAE